ncbi:MAG: 50S ribosomal protein L9 [Aeriscardovia sp.]|nr:50S ribosomal protein L9 [Aeriscardovia sp.]
MSKQIKIILTKDVPSLGTAGQSVEVAAGYARNFLVKEGLAQLWTAKAAQKEAAVLAKRDAEKLENRQRAAALKDALDGVTVVIPAKVSESGKLFGGISPEAIAEKLREKGIEVDPKTLHFEAIKQTGRYKVEARLYPQITSEFTVAVTEE